MARSGGCSTVAELVDRASGLLDDNLVDCPNVRYTRPMLIDYLNEAICRLQGLRPDAFTETLEFSLTPGKKQFLPDEFVSLGSVEFSVGADGKETTVSKVDQKWSKIFSKKSCLARDKRCDPGSKSGDPCADYAVKSFTKNKFDEAVFYVEPPVPKGCAPQVCATVVKKPQRFCSSDEGSCVGVDCEFDSALVDWIMYRALSGEVESAQARGVAVDYRTAFFNGLAANYLQESRFHSGYYTGHEGDGDKIFRQH